MQADENAPNADDIAARSREAREWIAAYRARTASAAGSGAPGAAARGEDRQPRPENVSEARQWIRSWRARTLEKNLPADEIARK